MAQIIDFSSRFTNELPMIKLDDDFIITVNNKKSTILNFRLLLQEREKVVNKLKNKGEELDPNKDDEYTMEMFKLFIGAKATEELFSRDLPNPVYNELLKVIINAASGTEEDTPSK